MCCSVVQCAALCCCVLQCTNKALDAYNGNTPRMATQRSAFYLTIIVSQLQHTLLHVRGGCMCCSVLQCVAVCCSVLQCVAVCCSVLQCVAVCCSVLRVCAYMFVCMRMYTTLLHYIAVRLAVCCSVLQCVAVCCSVLRVYVYMYVCVCTLHCRIVTCLSFFDSQFQYV